MANFTAGNVRYIVVPPVPGAVQKAILTILGYALIVYLISFIVFAIIRVFTGVSIKRLGYLSFRHISFSPKPGIRIFVGKLGLSFHTPTVARPGWMSVVASNVDVVVDPKIVLHPEFDLTGSGATPPSATSDDTKSAIADGAKQKDIDDPDWSIVPPRTILFYLVRFVLNYAKFLSVNINSASVTYTKISTLVIGNCMLRIDLRNTLRPKTNFVGTLDSYQLKPNEQSAHCKVTLEDFYIDCLVDDEEAREFLEFAIMDVDGIVGKQDLSLKDLSVSLKLGKSMVRVQRWNLIMREIRRYRQEGAREVIRRMSAVYTPEQMPVREELPQGLLSEKDVKTLTKVGTLLVRVVKEVEFKASYLGVFGVSADQSDSSVTLAASARDVSLDLRRLNSDSPGFKLFFQNRDHAHQAVLTIGSYTFGIDDGVSQEELLYVPLMTIVSKTNIFSKTLQAVQDNESQYNDTILRANFNIAQPTFNIGTKHASTLQKAMSGSSSGNRSKMSSAGGSFQRLWPRAVVKFTIDEPAARIVLDANPLKEGALSHSMVISNAAKIYCDFESSHSRELGKENYSVNGSWQLSSFSTWYRSPGGSRHDIVSSEELSFRMQAVTRPSLSVITTGKLSNAYIVLTKYEIFENLREVFTHVRKGRLAKQQALAAAKKMQGENHKENDTNPSFLRKLPPWCSQFKFEIADTAVSIASEKVRNDREPLRGLTVKMANSVIDYRSDVSKHGSHSFVEDGVHGMHDENKRRLTVVTDGVEGYRIMEPFGMDQKKGNQFLDIPSFSVLLFTSIVNKAPVLQCNVLLRQAVVTYDINLHFLALVVGDLVSRTLALDVSSHPDTSTPVKKRKSSDFLSLSVRSENVRVKLTLANQTHTMLEINNMMLVHKLASNPSLTASVVRLYAVHPTVKKAWCIIATLRGVNALYDKAAKATEDQVQLNFEALRLNMPYHFIYHHIFDNAVSFFKAIINLHQQIKTKNFQLVIKPKERSAIPNIPRIRIKARSLLVSMEEDQFESELGLILRLGQIEQPARLEKLQAFDDKVEVVCSPESPHHANDANATKENAAKKEIDPKCFIRKKFTANPSAEADHHDENTPHHSVDTDNDDVNTTGPESSAEDVTPLGYHRVKKHRTLIGQALSHVPLNHVPHGALNHIPHGHGHHYNLSIQHALHLKSSKGPKVNYKMTTACAPSREATVSVEEAHERLMENFSTSWIRLVKEARESRRKAHERNIERAWGTDEISKDTSAHERIVNYSDVPLLLFAHAKNLDMTVTKPLFDRPGLSQFLHDVGKGMPLNTRYSLLIPLHIQLNLAELRMNMKDYPLPLLHFPELQASQNQTLPAVAIGGHFVIAEQLWLADKNVRRIMVPLVPAAEVHSDDEATRRYIIEVNRTVTSVKMYTDLTIEANSLNPTRFTWAQSMQPALQTVMQGFDSFSKPPVDPSAKLGFWDKIRSVFHARLKFKWNGGDVYLLLKGSRNPYQLLGMGAGFVFAWRDNVTFTVNGDDNPQELMVARSNEFVWGVPSYVTWESEYLEQSSTFNATLHTRTNFSEMSQFEKIIMKLSGNVQWKVGLLFERDGEATQRSSKFIPHYDVQLSLPSFIKDLENYDAYKGFRSQYLHLAVGVSVTDGQSHDGTPPHNSAHLTSMTLRFFSSWWSLFDGSLSLPIRSGKLFQARQLTKPKFGRHLYTVQYQLQLSPVFISHSHRHTVDEEGANHKKEACTGLKGKVDSFTMDLHQRREPHPVAGQRWRMKLHLGELDFKGTDLRAYQAIFKEKTPEELLAMRTKTSESGAASPHPGSASISGESTGVSNSLLPSNDFSLPDNDLSWIDPDDYSEIGEIINVNSLPKIRVVPLLYTPRWSYFRQTDHSNSDIDLDSDGKEYSKFGNAPVHNCLIGLKHPEVTQVKLLKLRLQEINDQLKTDDATLDSLRQDHERFPDEVKISERIREIESQVENLMRRREAIQSVLEESGAMDDARPHASRDARSICSQLSSKSLEDLGEMANPKGTSGINNRFIIHNVQLKWNNKSRNAMYQYIHNIGYYRQLGYYMTRKAVKYIEDLIAKSGAKADGSDFTISKQEIADLVESVMKPESVSGSSESTKTAETSESSQERMGRFNEDLHYTLDPSHKATDSYLVRFVSPQIQLVSDVNKDHCLLITSRNIELKIVTIEDTRNDVEDMVRSVETRYGCMFDDARFFVLDKAEVLKKSVHLFGNNNYGADKDSTAWPPWLAVECCYDSTPLRKALVVDKTSVALRYDKPNALYVQKSPNLSPSTTMNGSIESSFCSRVVRGEKYRSNRMSVDFPRVVASCDSEQYFAIYTIAVDLLVYAEPAKKQTTETLERLLLTTDFSDVTNAIKRLNILQSDIQLLRTLRHEFYVRHTRLDENGLFDMLVIDVELRKVHMELSVMMQAIRSGLQRRRKDDSSHFVKWAVSSDEIIWHALGDDRKPMLDIGLADASFNRIEGPDGFNSNTVEVGMMQAFHLREDALYPEVLSPFNSPKHDAVLNSKEKLISVKWTMLDPIGGIPIMEQFDVRMQPLKIQLEHELGKNIFEYIFPAHRTSDSPFLIPSSTVDTTSAVTHHRRSGEFETKSIASSENESLSELQQARAHRQYLGRDHESIRSGSTAISASSTLNGGAVPGNGYLRTKGSFTSNASSRSSVFRQDSEHSNDSSTLATPTLGARHHNRKKKEEASADVSTMVKRASNYMSIVHIDIHSTVLCVSYKGPGGHSLTNLHEFVIKLPSFDYQNKTWSNLDLALHLKKDVIKVLFQHTGALISNKLTKHRKKRLQQPLRQISNYVSFTSVDELQGKAEGDSVGSKPAHKDKQSPKDRLKGVPEETHRSPLSHIVSQESSEDLVNSSPKAPASPSVSSVGGTPGVESGSRSPAANMANNGPAVTTPEAEERSMFGIMSNVSPTISRDLGSPFSKLRRLTGRRATADDAMSITSRSTHEDEEGHRKRGFLKRLGRTLTKE